MQDAIEIKQRRKQLLEESRLAALRDDPKNEMGESLDAMQDVWDSSHRHTWAGGLLKILQPSGAVFEPRELVECDKLHVIRQTEEAIRFGQLARANAATGEFLARRALKAEHKAEALRPRPYAQEHLISLNGASLQPTLDVCQGAVVRGIAFSPDGGAMATGDAACEARVWGRGLVPGARPWRSQRLLKGHMGAVTCVAFAPSGELGPGRVLFTGSGDWTVRQWAPAGPERRLELVGELPTAHRAHVLDLCYVRRAVAAAGGLRAPLLATAGGDNLVKVYALRAGARARLQSARSAQWSAASGASGASGASSGAREDICELRRSGEGAGEGGGARRAWGGGGHADWEVAASLRSHAGPVTAVRCSDAPLAFGHVLLASVSVDWTVKVRPLSGGAAGVAKPRSGQTATGASRGGDTRRAPRGRA